MLMNLTIKNLQVVPETLEPSLQLAAAVLAQVNIICPYRILIVACGRYSNFTKMLVLIWLFCVMALWSLLKWQVIC